MGWNDLQGSTLANQGSDKLGYTTFAEGNTIIRIVDVEPYSRWTHWIPYAKRSITCMGKGCPICNLIKDQKANKVKQTFNSTKRHVFHVLNRNTGNLELMEQGKDFTNNLFSFHTEIGDVTTYDIKVVRKGTGKDDTTYTLIPTAPKDLSDEDLALLEAKIVPAEYFKAPTYEQCVQIINGVPFADIFSNKSEDDDTVEVEE